MPLDENGPNDQYDDYHIGREGFKKDENGNKEFKIYSSRFTYGEAGIITPLAKLTGYLSVIPHLMRDPFMVSGFLPI